MLTRRPVSELFARGRDSLRGYRTLKLGLLPDREVLYPRLDARCTWMFENGLVDEVRGLLAEASGMSEQARAALGYAEIIAHLEGRMSLNDAVERIKINTRRFAKSQRTWFRRFRNIGWLDIAVDEPVPDISERALRLLDHVTCSTAQAPATPRA